MKCVRVTFNVDDGQTFFIDNPYDEGKDDVFNCNDALSVFDKYKDDFLAVMRELSNGKMAPVLINLTNVKFIYIINAKVLEFTNE